VSKRQNLKPFARPPLWVEIKDMVKVISKETKKEE
jgi:hypothetical protein